MYVCGWVLGVGVGAGGSRWAAGRVGGAGVGCLVGGLGQGSRGAAQHFPPAAAGTRPAIFPGAALIVPEVRAPRCSGRLAALWGYLCTCYTCRRVAQPRQGTESRAYR